jgi:hypothetical protein
VALMDSLLPHRLASASPALLDLPAGCTLEELRLLVAQHTQGALVPGRVFKVVGRPGLLELLDDISLEQQGVFSGDLLRLEALPADSIRSDVWAYAPGGDFAVGARAERPKSRLRR